MSDEDTLDTTADIELSADDGVEADTGSDDVDVSALKRRIEELEKRNTHLEGLKNISFKERDKYKAKLAKQTRAPQSKDEELEALKRGFAEMSAREQFNDALAFVDANLTPKQVAYLRTQAIKIAPDDVAGWLTHTVDVMGLSSPVVSAPKGPDASAKGRLPAQPSPSVEPSTNLPSDPRLIEKNLWRSMTSQQRQEQMSKWNSRGGSSVATFIEGMRKRRNG